MLIDFRERGGEKWWSVASPMCPNFRPNPQGGHVPWLGIEPTTFQFMGQLSNQWSHTGQGSIQYFIK